MIGILGGTFDPIHFGHLRPALEILEILELDELRFIPSATPPHRWQPEASAEDRIEMVRLALKENDRFILDDREYHREGASYTIDTLRSIRAEIGTDTPFCMIVGTDAFQSFTSWRDWEKILDVIHLVVASRPGYCADEYDSDQLDDDTSSVWFESRLSTNTRELHAQPAGKVFFCDVTQLDVSATFIRKQLLNGGSCSYLTPKDVVKYITKNQLYIKS